MKTFRLWSSVLPLLFVTMALGTFASAQQQRVPNIGYVYPAGGQAGTTFQVTVGGQFLDGVREIVFSGEGLPEDGIQAKVVRLVKPPTQKQLNDLQEKLTELRDRVREEATRRRRMGLPADYRVVLMDLAKEAGISAEDIQVLEEFRRIRNDPKRQPTPQIAERMILEVTVSPGVPQGTYLLRAIGAATVTPPLRFQIGPWPELSEREPNEGDKPQAIEAGFPLVINGQILPGDVDRFRFAAKKGQRLTAVVFGRELIPYLADAVPGWFQATLSLQTADGKELAYVDDYRFHPDPVLSLEIPGDGDYVLEIKDSVFRGREDFVYRIVVGEIPFVTAVKPAGIQQGETGEIQLDGWNLAQHSIKVSATDLSPGVHALHPSQLHGALGRVLIAVDSLHETAEKEPNDSLAHPQTVGLDQIVNGAIDRPGDQDYYAFSAKKGAVVVLETVARRLGSPVDSYIRLIAPDGQQLAMGDDWEDKGVGWLTHHADSYVLAELPLDGTYRAEVRDMQQGGGPDYIYRLRISQPLPDFQLRVVPSCLNVQPGGTVPLDVYALRKDGFDGAIEISIQGAGPNVKLSGNYIPAGQDRTRMTLTLPPSAPTGLFSPKLIGQAQIAGRNVAHEAQAADDLMQAFFYRHLVTVDHWSLFVSGRPRFLSALAPTNSLPLQIPAGGNVQVQYVPPRFGRGGMMPRIGFATFGFELSEPPEGISLGPVSRTGDRIAVDVQASADVPPGLKGNLIFQVFTEQKRPNSNQSIKVPVGVLPAVPFEIVPRRPTADRADASHPGRS